VRGAVVVKQIAVSFVLVIAAGLFLRTFASLRQLPLGFVPQPLAVVNVNLFASGIPPEQQGARVERLRDAAAVPGVRSLSVSQMRRAPARTSTLADGCARACSSSATRAAPGSFGSIAGILREEPGDDAAADADLPGSASGAGPG
jgi:hypothetical protein